MNQFMLYEPRDEYKEYRGKSLGYLKDNGFPIISDTYTHVWQEPLDTPITDPRKFMKKTIMPWAKENGYRSCTGMVLTSVQNGLLSQWFLDQKRGATAIHGFLHFPEDRMKEGMKGVRLHGREGTWSVYDSCILDNTSYYIMENEISAENGFVIVNGQGDVLADGASGFDDNVIAKIREKSADNTKRKDRLSSITSMVTAIQGEESYDRFPGLPRGELKGREHCGQRVSARARLQEKQQILRKYSKIKGQ